MSSQPTIVALVECRSYENERVEEAVRRGLEFIGGLDSVFINREKKLLLKPNALSAKDPGRCVTTHPTVFRAVARILQEAHFELTYGDSPSVGKIPNVMAKIGIKPVADELDIPLADFENGRTVSFPEGRRIRQFYIADGVLECDAIVNLPKLKTHRLTRMTGAVKNQFGCIPGFSKPEFHVKLPDAEQFAEMLVDLNRLLKPKLYIMDAIQSMEGNGPGSGEPVETGFVLIGTDPVALDTVACLTMNISHGKVPTNRIGAALGLGVGDSEKIQIVGDNWQKFVQKDFVINRGIEVKSGSPLRTRLARTFLVLKPTINRDLCQCCNVCVEQCPVTPKALFWKNDDHTKPPVYDYQKCIRCYCCQEVCPYGAIFIRAPILRKIFDLLYPF